jgi:hypothetical protein
VRVAVRLVQELYLGEDIPGGLDGFGLARALYADGRVDEVAHDAHVREEVETLKHHADFERDSTQGLLVFVPRAAADCLAHA